MAQQISKKFLGDNQVDGSKIKIEQGQSLVAIDHTGAAVDLLKIDSSTGQVTVNGIQPASASDVSTAQSDISALQSDVSTAQSDITELQSDVSVAQNSIGSLQSSVGALETDVTALESDNVTNKSDISTLKSDMSTAKTDITNAKSDINTLEGDVNNLEARIGTSESNISSLLGRMSDAESNISTNSSDISHLSGRIDTVQSTTNSLDTDINALQSDVSSLQSDVSSLQSDVVSLQTDVDSKISSSEKGANSGVAPLNSSGKIEDQYLPSSILGALKYKGSIDASLGVYPSSPAQGDYWIVSTEGSISGHVFHAGDWMVYNGSSWDDIDNSQTITSVNSKVGAVVLDSDDISEGSSNLYFTEARASAASPVQSVAGKTGTVVLAKADVGLGNVDNTSDASKPVSTAVQTALDLKQNSLGTGTSTQFLRGDLTWATPSKPSKVFVVGIDASTIAGCIALCSSPSLSNNYIIEIPPGSYTENLTIPGNVHLKALSSPNDTLSVKITGEHTITGSSANALNNRVVISNIQFASSHSTSAILSVSGTSAATQVQITGCYFGQTASASTAKGISIGNYGAVYLHATTIRLPSGGSGGTQIVMAAGSSLYSQYGLDADGGTCAIDMQGAAYAQLLGALISTQGTQAVKIAASGSVMIGHTTIGNAAAVGHGVNMVGSGAGFVASHSVFNVLNDATSYAVNGVAGSVYGFFAMNYGNLPGVATRNVKISSNVTQIRYSGSLAAADLSDFSSSAQSAVVVNAINSGVTATAPSQAAVYTALGNKLATAGGTMSGAIAMGSNKVTGLADPSAGSQEAATAAYVDAAGGLSAGLAASGTSINMTATARKISVTSGSTATKVILPSLSNLVVGEQANIINTSSAILTIRNPGDTADVASLPPGHMAFVTVANLSGAGTFGSAVIQLRSSGYNAASSKITNLADGSASTDAVNKGQLDLKLNLAGGTMSGAIAMGSNKITGLGAPTANSTDAATTAYVDTAVAANSGSSYDKESFTLSSADIANGYINLARLAKAKSIHASVGRLAIHEGATHDYTVSTVGGVSRITFLNSLVYPGVEALVAGDVVFVEYAY
jgi:predicted  nucleic acid-binding Zn-ribbon protein